MLYDDKHDVKYYHLSPEHRPRISHTKIYKRGARWEKSRQHRLAAPPLQKLQI